MSSKIFYFLKKHLLRNVNQYKTNLAISQKKITLYKSRQLNERRLKQVQKNIGGSVKRTQINFNQPF